MHFDPEAKPNEPTNTLSTRLWGLGLGVLCLIFLLSLFSYNIEEIAWPALNSEWEKAQKLPCTNILGVAGLYIGGVLYSVLGAGAVYATLAMIVPVGGMLIFPQVSRLSQWIAWAAILLSSVVVLGIQPWILQEWAAGMQLKGAGGQMGYLLGQCVAMPLIGGAWALILLLLAHGAALIYYARLTPAEVGAIFWTDLISFISWSKAKFQNWREERAARQYAAEQAWQQQQQEIKEREEPATPEQPDNVYTEPGRSAIHTAKPLPIATSNGPQPRQPVRQSTATERYQQPRNTAAPARISEQERAARDQAAREQSARERAAREQAAREQEAREQAEREQEARERAAREQEAREQAARERAAREQAAREQAARERAARNTPAPRPATNLLDLLKPVEEEIAQHNSPEAVAADVPDYDDRDDIHINPRLEAAANRRMGIRNPEPAPAPAPQRPAPAPAPQRPAPRNPELPLDDMRTMYEDYPLPPYDLLEYHPIPQEVTDAARDEMYDMQQRIIDTLATFKINVTEGDITRGPSITRYEFHPPKGLRVNRISNLNNELMLSTCSKSVNILAPIPGKDTVGIELENATKSPVYLRELLQSEAFHNPKYKIPVALGKNVYGEAVIGDLAAMPHTLVAGTTGSGKSVCINSMILSMLYKFRPDELRLILVDPKVVEMQPYKKLPHLVCPVVTNPARVIGALRWAVNEMERRYKMFSKVGVRNFADFNKRPEGYCGEEEEEEVFDTETPVDYAAIDRMESEILRQADEEIDLEEETQEELDFEEEDRIPDRLPYIVIIIDELADLMMVVKEDLENYIARLTQKARAAGMHLVVATQTPRSNVVTGIIKANIPSRIALKVSSPLDSRIILDTGGAENLLGKGDFLFLPPEGIMKITRAQGAWVSDQEIASIIKFCAAHAKQNFDKGITAEMNNSDGTGNSDNGGRITGSRGGNDEDDELYTHCVQLVIAERKASTSLLQRRFSIGYGRAAKIMDMMEARGVISPPQGATRAREVLVEPME